VAGGRRALFAPAVGVTQTKEAIMADEPTSFIDYWDAVDDAMRKIFDIDTSDAGIDADLLASAQEECQTPEEFARWWGEKYDLEYLDDLKILWGR
jgi:hypothetical protein